MEPVTIAVGTAALSGLLSLLLPPVRRAIKNQTLSRKLGERFTIGPLAVDTTDKKLAVMEWDLLWEPGIPIAPTTPFGQAEKQQLLWGYPGITWTSITGTVRIVQGPNLGRCLISVPPAMG